MNAAPRYLVLHSLTHRVLTWSYDPARALGVCEGLRARSINCYMETRS